MNSITCMGISVEETHETRYAAKCGTGMLRLLFSLLSYQLKLTKMRTELTDLNHCAVLFLSRAPASIDTCAAVESYLK